MKYDLAPDIKKKVDFLIDQLKLTHIKKKNIHCIRSYQVKTRAYARIWGMSKLFKQVVGLQPHYIIEVNDQKFRKLSQREKIKTLIHELMHIPKTFSGALLPHRSRYHKINEQAVERLVKTIDV